MITPETKYINKKKFYFQPLGLFKALKLDKKIITLLLPALSRMKNLKLDSEIDLGAMFGAVAEALGGMKDEDFISLIKELLSTTQHLPESGQPEDLTEDLILTKVFTGDLMGVYKLLFEVMKFNKFSPFELMGDGNKMEQISSLLSKNEKQKEIGNKSEKSDSSKVN